MSISTLQGKVDASLARNVRVKPLFDTHTHTVHGLRHVEINFFISDYQIESRINDILLCHLLKHFAKGDPSKDSLCVQSPIYSGSCWENLGRLWETLGRLWGGSGETSGGSGEPLGAPRNKRMSRRYFKTESIITQAFRTYVLPDPVRSRSVADLGGVSKTPKQNADGCPLLSFPRWAKMTPRWPKMS